MWYVKKINIWKYQVFPSLPRIPTANTVAYYPLTSEYLLKDMKWRGTAYDFSNLWSAVSFWTYNWVDCVSFSGWGKCLKSDVWQLYQTFTLSWRFYITQEWNYQSLIMHWWLTSSSWRSNWGCMWSWYNRSLWLAITSWGSPEVIWNTVSTWRHHICVTKSSSWCKVYCDWVLWATTSAFTVEWRTQFVCWWHPWNYQSQDVFYWCASNLIFESVERTAEEVLAHYNKLKSLYWL